MKNTEPTKAIGLGEAPAGSSLNTLLDSFAGIVFLIDAKTGETIYSSKHPLEWLGFSLKNETNKKGFVLEKLMHPDDLAEYKERINTIRALSHNQKYEIKERYRHAQGGYHWYATKYIVYEADKDGTPTTLMRLSYDISAQEGQRREMEKLALIAQKTTNAIIITNRNLRITWINDGYTRLTGYTLAEVKGKRATDLLAEHESNAEALERINNSVANGASFVEELGGYTKTGEEYWMRINADPTRDLSGKTESFIAIGQNITELKKNSEELIKSNERLKHYAFFTSHQLRSPVADILSILDVFDYDHPENPDNKRLLQDLKTVSVKLDGVVHDLNKIVAADRVRYADENRKNHPLESIMLVDDDRVFNNITTMILRKLNPQLTILSYTRAANALETLKGPKAPDAVFLDINMPDMNGWDFLNNLEALGVKVPVYMLTSSIDPEDIKKAKTYEHVKGYFTKPLTKSVLTKYFVF